MIARILIILISLLPFTIIKAQTHDINGTVTDQQSKLPLRGATVQLRSTSDSTISISVTTDSSGKFSFTSFTKDSFRINISFVGYNSITRGIRLDSTDVSITVSITPNASSELATVIVTANISPVTQKGDTIQINASQYKVNPDASGEDLVKKMPGITIENGQVKAHGENVQKVTIDGRELFGDDATAALRNLPAEVIDKIQIFDRLSDQAQFTGFDDGSSTKAINIITKANMRNGQFGRVFAGYGTDSRYQLGGNATIFKNNERLSIVGLVNNVNQQNFSQQDLLGVTSNSQRGGGGGGPRGGGQRGG
ncbi:MAG TPA: carboxypeptidase-like regulatory domain-containing protein, partial [Flavisolibacter sp.]|nr:carboxypeptidase-like regulatory domain-containing protein [Flavisolibacter sp.]